MKRVLLLLLSVCTAGVIQTKKPHNVRFVILMTSYNNEKYAESNLESVAYQKSTNPYRIIYINDCSTDKTKEVVDAYVRKHNLESKITVIHNTTNVGGLANVYNAMHTYVEDDEVVVNVDGDDWLPHNEVLLRLEEEYKSPDVWMTYGTARVVPDGHTKGKQIPYSALIDGSLRTLPNRAQHLKTWRAALFKKIKKEDLLYEGDFFQMTWDRVMMYPMLEMSGPVSPGAVNHSKYIKDIMYLYNHENPISDFKKNAKLQKKLRKHIVAMQPYAPLETLENSKE